MKPLLACVALLLSTHAFAQDRSRDAGARSPLVERGRYIVQIGGCNDCHTPAYGMKAGKVPERDWLVGDSLGWQGPWGTTYATNLRLHFSRISQAQWLQQARTMQSRPPMPWFVFRHLSDRELKAIHAYVRSLGPAGQPAPAALPPGQAPAGPVVKFPG